MSVVVDSMQDVQAFGDMSPAIIEMLRDEANLSTARHVLEDARQDFAGKLEAHRQNRPAFGILGSKKQRDDYAANVAALENQLQFVDAMLVRVNAARERLQPGLRASLVDYLNRVDPTYRQGLKASRFHEHWHRAYSVVADRFQAFVRDLRELRNGFAADAERGKSRPSTETIRLMGIARTAGIELDREIDALNKVSADHQAFVANTPFTQVRLPAIQRWSCTQKIDLLSLATAPAGLTEADQLLSEFNELRLPSLTTLLSLFEAAASEHAQLAEMRLRQCWSSLLAHAEAHLVSDAELEPTLADIEQRQAEAMRRVASAQINARPFDIER